MWQYLHQFDICATILLIVNFEWFFVLEVAVQTIFFAKFVGTVDMPISTYNLEHQDPLLTILLDPLVAFTYN